MLVRFFWCLLLYLLMKRLLQAVDWCRFLFERKGKWVLSKNCSHIFGFLFMKTVFNHQTSMKSSKVCGCNVTKCKLVNGFMRVFQSTGHPWDICWMIYGLGIIWIDACLRFAHRPHCLHHKIGIFVLFLSSLKSVDGSESEGCFCLSLFDVCCAGFHSASEANIFLVPPNLSSHLFYIWTLCRNHCHFYP